MRDKETSRQPGRPAAAFQELGCAAIRPTAQRKYIPGTQMSIFHARPLLF